VSGTFASVKQVIDSWRSKAALGPLVIAIFTGACVPENSLPGTSEGTFSVAGTLGTNSCGSGVGASNPWDFTVELSEDDSTLYLAQSDGSDEISGTLSSTSATLTSTVTSNVDGSDAGAGTCDLTQVTTYALKLSSASSPSSFTGSATYTYSVATGLSTSANCTDQLASSGGEYSTLPCTITYSLTGTRQ
jgi:hypothetical protein